MPVQRDRDRDFFAPTHPVCNDSPTMRQSRVRASAVMFGLATVLVSGTAAAKRHTIERGETLIHIARAYNCSVEEIQRANGIDTTLIRAGAILKIPACKKVAARVDRPRKDGIAKPRPRKAKPIAIEPVEGQSVGAPWDGELHDGVRLHLGDGFKI